MTRRVDIVSVALSRGAFEFPWDSRQELFDRMFYFPEAMPSVRRRFEAVGTSRPAEFTREEKSYLMRVIEDWAQPPGTFDDLLPGIYELHNALIDDLQDAGI